MIDSDKHMDTDREKMSRAKYEEMFMGEKGSNICGFDMNRFMFLFYFGCNNFMCPKIENGGRFNIYIDQTSTVSKFRRIFFSA